MIGIVIVSHGNLGGELLRTAEIISGENLDVRVASMDSSEDAQGLRRQIKDAITSADKGYGVLVLTDLFGGTPSNVCISLMDELNLEVVSGVNLPMLIKISSLRDTGDLKEAAFLVKEYGKKNISAAGDILRKKVGV